MLKFKQFIQLLEDLNPTQKQTVSGWMGSNKIIPDNQIKSEKAIQLSKHIIPEGEDTITIPVIPHVLNAVHDHLTSHGYTMDNYGKGTAIDQYKRPVSIASILQKTNAPQELIDNFANDDRETAQTLHQYDGIVTRNPYRVAECSTNKPWANCATLNPDGTPTPIGAGLAAQKLPHEIHEGTHAVYLVPKSTQHLPPQQRIDHAVARVLLKPYKSEEGHEILAPEEKVYSGTSSKNIGFLQSIKDFTNKYFPMKPGTIYRKNPNVYDDDKISTRFDTSDGSIDKLKDEYPSIVGNSGNLSHSLMNKLLDHYISTNNKKGIAGIGTNIKANKATINKILDVNDDATNKYIASFARSLHPENISRLIPEYHNLLLDNKNLKLSENNFDQIIDVAPRRTIITLLNDHGNKLSEQNKQKIANKFRSDDMIKNLLRNYD